MQRTLYLDFYIMCETQIFLLLNLYYYYVLIYTANNEEYLVLINKQCFEIYF